MLARADSGGTIRMDFKLAHLDRAMGAEHQRGVLPIVAGVDDRVVLQQGKAAPPGVEFEEQILANGQ